MQTLRPVMLTVLTLSCGTPAAQIFQCTDQQGVVAFQDTACSEGPRVIRQLPSSAGAGLRQAERAWLKRLKKGTPAKPKPVPRRSSSKDDLRQEQTCWKKRRQLEQVRTKLRRGYKASQGEKLRRSRRDYQDYLSRYCD